MPVPEITEDQLAKWTALCDAATPGPWKHGPESHGVYNPNMGSPLVVKPIVDEARNPDDAAFIAAARTAMPTLIAALREARERHERLLGGFGDLQELLNALAVEQAKVKRLREALARCQPRLLARWFDADDARKGRVRLHGNDVQEALEEAARVLKETEDGT